METKVNSVWKYLIGVLVTIGILLFCWYFFKLIAYILIAVMVSFVGQPIVNVLGKVRISQWKPGKALKAGFALISIWILFLLFLALIIPLVYGEFESLRNWNPNDLMRSLDVPLNTAEQYLRSFGLIDMNVDIKSRILVAASSVFTFTGLTDIFGTLAGAVSTIGIGMFAVSFIAFFFLKDSDLFTKMVLTLTPTKYESQVMSALKSCERLLVRYFVGLLLEMFAVMVLNTIGLSIVGLELKHSLVIAMVTGLMIIVPYVGPLIGMLLGLSIAVVTSVDVHVTNDLLSRLMYMEIVFLITQSIDSFFFQPYIYGNSVHAHPLEIFLVILLAGSLAGIPGMILAIPCYTILRVVLVEFFSKYNLVQKLTKNIREEINH